MIVRAAVGVDLSAPVMQMHADLSILLIQLRFCSVCSVCHNNSKVNTGVTIAVQSQCVILGRIPHLGPAIFLQVYRCAPECYVSSLVCCRQ